MHFGSISNDKGDINRFMNTVELRKWIKINEVDKKIQIAFKECFENYRIASPDEFARYFGDFDSKLLKIKIKK